MADDKDQQQQGDQQQPPVEPGKAPTAQWRESFEDADVKGATTLDKFKGKDDRELLGHVAKAYVNLEKMPRGVAIPKDDAPQAEWDAFYDKVGRPKDVDGYGIDLKVPENVPWSKDAERLMLSKMRAHGLTKRQAEGVLGDYLAITVDGLRQIEQGKTRDAQGAYDAMKAEWGGLTDRNVALVQRAVHEFGGNDLKEYLDNTGLGNDPRFFKFVFALSSPLLEDGYIQGDGLGMKRDEARAELKKIMGSDEYLKYKGSPNAPARRELIARIEALAEIANSE